MHGSGLLGEDLARVEDVSVRQALQADANGFQKAATRMGSSISLHDWQPVEAPFKKIEEGRRWRYRWWDDFTRTFFDDVCAVVRCVDNTSYIGSAVVAAPTPAREVVTFFRRIAAAEKESGCLGDVLFPLDTTISRWPANKARTLRRRLLALRQEVAGEPHPAAQRSRRGPSPFKKQSAEELEKQAQEFEDVGRRETPSGDLQSAALAFASTLYCRELARHSELDEDNFARGVANGKRSRRHFAQRGSGIGSGPNWPPGPPCSPLTSLARLGIPDLKLPPEAGQETFHGTSFGLPGGCETYQTRSTVVTLDASASVPAGSFRRCLLVESSIATSREDDRFHQAERERARDYFAGTRRAWFAPGIGLVRLRYAHANGEVTDVQLTEYEVKRGGRQYAPCAVDNWWRYQWRDPARGTQFEETRKVVVRENDRVLVAYAVSVVPRTPAYSALAKAPSGPV